MVRMRWVAIFWVSRDIHSQSRETVFLQEVAVLQVSVKIVYSCSEHSTPAIHYLQVEEA